MFFDTCFDLWSALLVAFEGVELLLALEDLQGKPGVEFSLPESLACDRARSHDGKERRLFATMQVRKRALKFTKTSWFESLGNATPSFVFRNYLLMILGWFLDGMRRRCCWRCLLFWRVRVGCLGGAMNWAGKSGLCLAVVGWDGGVVGEKEQVV